MASNDQSGENQSEDNSQSKSAGESEKATASGLESVPESKLPPTPNGQSTPSDKPKARSERIKNYFEIGGIIAGIAGVIVLIIQSFLMTQATKATRDSVEMTKGQLEIMKRQLEDSEMQQRARIVIKDFRFIRETNFTLSDKKIDESFSQGLLMKGTLVIQNMGSTPAVDLGFEGQAVGIDEGQTEANGFPVKSTNLSTSEIVESNVFSHFFTNKTGILRLKSWGFQSENIPPNPDQNGGAIAAGEIITNIFEAYSGWPHLDNLKSGKSLLYYEWRASYRDIFDNARIVRCAVIYDLKLDSFRSTKSYWRQYHRDQEKAEKH